ncbi:hypothetical protein [Pseudomonas sp. S9]|uniref:hypothetical protein n=1 Tax=Pseudomonas sp. S9 TaxID=686578 RepID=UPI0002557656|nr:hypothetical protein [Pseudomonas sp. S9]
MSVFSPDIENRLTALTASFMVRKADALEAISRLTALDLQFVDPAQRNRLLRLQSALLAYLKSPADALQRTRFLSCLRACEAGAQMAEKQIIANQPSWRSSETFAVEPVDSPAHSGRASRQRYTRRHSVHRPIPVFIASSNTPSEEFDFGPALTGHIDEGWDCVLPVALGQMSALSNTDYPNWKDEPFTYKSDPAQGVLDAMVGILTVDSAPYLGMFDSDNDPAMALGTGLGLDDTSFSGDL